MGEVYKAADTRLNRTVAIKVLPTQFSEDPEMKQRFEREAQTIAALNHPNICTLYDVGRQDGADFLVMEFLEGETLAARIARGPLPLPEALKVGVAIADALDKAHRKGVTHRDLKPGNVMLTASGAKLLDFGLAKLKQQTAPADQSQAPASGNTTSPGTILGTMQYMAPEQLEGKEADARTDIFAFGATLYEMISGKRAFEGKSKAHLIAAIVSAEPDALSKVQPETPPALEFLVKRCLDKDPEERLQTAWDALCQLQWIAEGGSATGIPYSAKAPRRLQPAQLVVAAAALLALVVAVPAVLKWRAPQRSEETRFVIPTPDMPLPEAAVISPDGRAVAYSARDGGGTFLFVRPLDTDTPVKLPGTEGAATLFWSPDGRSLAFFAGGKLKRVQASGGPPENICETADMNGGSWNAEDVIVFASTKGLHRVRAVGGEAVAIGTPKDGAPYAPSFLPDGRHFVYLVAQAQGSNGAIYAGSLGSNDSVRLVSAQSNAVYAEPGYLLYHREGTLYAHPFNANKLTLTGEAIRIADKLPYAASGVAAFSSSSTGVLIFRRSPDPVAQASSSRAPTSSVYSQPLVWVDRFGKKFDQLAPAAGWAGVALSPNGKRVAAHRHDAEGGDVWIFEAGQADPAKFTFDATQDNSSPLWTPDGAQIAFASRRSGKWGLYIKMADNTRNEELLLESDSPVVPMSWTPDGQTLVYWTAAQKTQGDVWSLSLKGEKKPNAILTSPADERHPQLSPDGKWLAYSSNETGRSEVYVQPFPNGTKIQVSVNGGVFPRWGSAGRELYFLNLLSAGALMISNIRVTGAAIQREDPKILFQSGYFNSVHNAGGYHPYAASGDGQRFLMPQIDNPMMVFNGRGGAVGITPGPVMTAIYNDRHAASSAVSGPGAPINVVMNWTAGLKEN